MSSAVVASFGLILDIVGALIIWYFVAEINFADKADYLGGKATLKLADPTPEEIRSYKNRMCASRFGVTLLVLGFVLQLVGQLCAPTSGSNGDNHLPAVAPTEPQR